MRVVLANIFEKNFCQNFLHLFFQKKCLRDYSPIHLTWSQSGPAASLVAHFSQLCLFFPLFRDRPEDRGESIDAQMDFDESNVPRMEKAQPLLRAVSTAYEDM